MVILKAPLIALLAPRVRLVRWLLERRLPSYLFLFYFYFLLMHLQGKRGSPFCKEPFGVLIV